MTLTDTAIEKLMKEVDANGDGTIDYNEFILMMRKNTEFSKIVKA